MRLTLRTGSNDEQLESFRSAQTGSGRSLLAVATRFMGFGRI
jgi:hypothetical protein